MTSPLFFIGNKRSGTSLIVRLLNLHKEVFVSHEADLAWILYQAEHGIPDEYSCYELDVCYSMRATLAAHGNFIAKRLAAHLLLDNPNRIRDTFFETERRLARLGSGVQMPYSKKATLLLGDKKPVQQCDPVMREFMYRVFPDAKYIHMIRHPYAVVFSKIVYMREKSPVPHFWEEDFASLLNRWAKHERWALDMDSINWGIVEEPNVIRIRLEEFAADPYTWMQKLFRFLDLEMPAYLKEEALQAMVDENPNSKYQDLPIVPTPDEVIKLMHEYGYKVEVSEGALE